MIRSMLNIWLPLKLLELIVETSYIVPGLGDFGDRFYTL